MAGAGRGSFPHSSSPLLTAHHFPVQHRVTSPQCTQHFLPLGSSYLRHISVCHTPMFGQVSVTPASIHHVAILWLLGGT